MDTCETQGYYFTGCNVYQGPAQLLNISKMTRSFSKCPRMKNSFIIPHRLIVGRPTPPFLEWCLKKLGAVKLNNPVQNPDEP